MEDVRAGHINRMESITMSFTAIQKVSTKAWFALAALVTVLSGIATIYATFHEANPNNPSFIGRWNTDYNYPITNGTFEFKGMTEYFRNGRYNVNGIVIVDGTVEAKPYRLEYSVIGAGSWTADSSLLSFTLADMKTTPKSYVINGTAIPPSLVAKLAGPSMPNLSDGYASGTSDEAKIVAIKDDVITLEGKDPAGKAFTIQTYRQH
jgi:hypothetical protein